MAAADRLSHNLVAATIAFVAVTSLSAAAHAQSTNAALAETLFQEARRLIAEKNYAEACPKLAESQRLDPATGTLLNLAVCHQDEGKLATAWVEFNNALSSARRDRRPDREQLAREHIATLEPRLSHVTLVVPEAARVPGLEVKLDGTTVGAAAWGLSVPVDSGAHALTASAPGKRTWSSRFDVADGAGHQAIEIPVLATDVPVVVVVPPPNAAQAVGSSQPPALPPPVVSDGAVSKTASPPSASTPSGHLRTAAYVVGGAGVVSLGVGAIFGLRAYSKWSDRNANCPANSCNAAGVSDYNAANSSALVADITLGVGLAAVATGAVLWFRSRSPETGAASATGGGSSLSLLPSFGPGTGGAVLGGQW
jgi:hypothetical protein